MRLFVALDIPDQVRQALARLRERLEKLCCNARWVRLEGVHVTLKFMGEVPAERLPAIRAALEKLPGRAPLELRFAGLGFFPDARRPRVFWAGIEGGAALAELAAAVETSLEPLGIAREKRDFHPHLTLARLESTQGLDPLRSAAEKFRETEFGCDTARELYLYQSVLKREGAEYTRVGTFSFSPEHRS